MNKRANLYFAALLGAMSPLCTVSALAAQSNSTIATATQQQNSCTGTVKDATGEPIIGATIRIEGKTGGTVTDLDGNFTLSNIEKGAKLTITYVGYKSQTLITAKPKAHAFKNEMCFPLTKTKCELKKHPNSKFECFFNDFNRTKTSLFLPFPSKLIQDNLVCVLELQE